MSNFIVKLGRALIGADESISKSTEHTVEQKTTDRRLLEGNDSSYVQLTKETDFEYNIASADRFYAQGNYVKAFQINLMTAKEGSHIAQLNVGYAYDVGEGVAQNKVEAFKWYLLAAEQGNVDAQGNVAICYTLGEGVTQNNAEAFKWYMAAAQRGHCPSQHTLGVHYDNIGNSAEAASWYKCAAERGYPQSQYNLGISYLNGEGVNKSTQEAKYWINKAAQQGVVEAVQLLQRI